MTTESFDLFCPECNILVSGRVIARGSGGFRSSTVSPLDEVDTEYHGDHYSVAQCPRCSSPFLVRESLFGIPGEFETVTDTVVLYPFQSRLPLDDVPDSIRRVFDEALRAYGAALYDSCALMSRRCLEVAARELGAAAGNLAEKLDELAHDGVIDARLRDWAHGIRLIGNEAAHDLDAGVAKEDARDVLDFTEALLLYVFVLKRRFERFRARRECR